MTAVAQRSFAGGEIAPALYGRTDISKRQSGLRTCRNFLVTKQGGVMNRPGSEFVAEVKDSSNTVRLIEFVFNDEQTYVLEFGNLYMRVHKQGVQVLNGTNAITAASQANPCQVTSNAHGYANGDEVVIEDVGGMTELNGRHFKVAGVTANTFTLTHLDGTAVNSTAFGAYTAGGTVAKVYELTTPYVEADLPDLRYVQSADVLTIVHKTYAPRELARSGDAAWTLTEIEFEPSIDRPTNAAGVAGGAGTNTYKYAVTAIHADTGEESLASFGAGAAISGITSANPAVFTSNAHGLADGDEVVLSGFTQDGWLYLNEDGPLGPENVYEVTNVTANTFRLRGRFFNAGLTPDVQNGAVRTDGFAAYNGAGSFARRTLTIKSAAAPTVAAPHVLSWSAVNNAGEYNIYKESNGSYGLVGVSKTLGFSDTGITADTADGPPISRNPFRTYYPSAVAYYQQRLVFGGTDEFPEGVFASKTGLFNNFSISSPIQDDDAVTFTIVGRKVSRVQHLVDMGKLLVLTFGSEWAINGDGAGVLTPTGINAKQYGYNGAAALAPIIVGGSALFVQARGSGVRDIGFDFEIDGYRGNDLTVFASHLFEGRTLVDWAYQSVPGSIVWAVRDDGVLLGMTYVREHELLAWHRHDTEGGAFENVCAVPEGGQDRIYTVANRTIDGRTVRYIERHHPRFFEEVEDAVFLDSALSFDGTNDDAAHTMDLSGGVTWDEGEDLNLESSEAFFSAVDVGNVIILYGEDGTVVRCAITAYVDSENVTVQVDKEVPVAMRAATADWARAVDRVTGLWHLEGESISAFCDGFVAANALTDEEPNVVTDGAVEFDECYAKIHVGLPITADIETLDLDTSEGEPLADKKKLINRLTLLVESSRGIYAGERPRTVYAGDGEPDAEAGLLTGLQELKLRDDEVYDDPVGLQTAPVSVNMKARYNQHGRVFVRQIDPIPLSILAAIPQGTFGAGR